MEKTNSNSDIIEIFTDGGCSNNPGEGGIGILLRYKNHTKEINGYVPMTTNNQMELLAVIIALENLNKSCKITLYTDSKYLQTGITSWIFNWKKNNWKSANKTPVKNQKLWKKLDELSQQHEINFQWVKGHAGHEENEKVDNLCNLAIKDKAPVLNNYLHLLEV